MLHLLFLIAHGQLHRYMAPWGIAVFLVFAFLCIATGIWQYRSGLVPFGRLRQQLMGLRSGAGEKLEGNYPAEVQPLVNDLNTLLEQRERAIRRALSKAGDLAHGLKTPLAVLAQEAEELDSAGQKEIASVIGLQVERMRRQIEYHLSQARTITPGNVAGTRCPVQVCVEGLTRTLEKIYAARGLAIKVDVAAEHSVRGQREDLEEILGNLLDNACKWARTAVRIQSLQEKDAVVLLVDDDGPGLPSSMRDEVLKRGVRMDEAAPGSGLGLAIARDLVQLYEGTLKLEESPMGGLRARVRLPC
ncbi:MAG TPA: ATP-binding protein [Candidatus Acidoferrum sp.]|nr:ATP-binding protein [Candidatus Acidoferrum sp.]